MGYLFDQFTHRYPVLSLIKFDMADFMISLLLLNYSLLLLSWLRPFQFFPHSRTLGARNDHSNAITERSTVKC